MRGGAGITIGGVEGCDLDEGAVGGQLRRGGGGETGEGAEGRRPRVAAGTWGRRNQRTLERARTSRTDCRPFPMIPKFWGDDGEIWA